MAILIGAFVSSIIFWPIMSEFYETDKDFDTWLNLH